MTWRCHFCQQLSRKDLGKCANCGSTRPITIQSIIDQTRECRVCKSVKHVNDFYILRHKRKNKIYEYRQKLCKSCQNKHSNYTKKLRMANVDYAKKDQEYHRNYQREYYRKRAKETL